MSLPGVDLLDRSIGKASAWPAGIDAGLGSRDRRLAYRVLKAWLSGLQDRMARRRMPAGAVAQASALLPADVRELLEPARASRPPPGPPPAGRPLAEDADVNARPRHRGQLMRPCHRAPQGSSPVPVKG